MHVLCAHACKERERRTCWWRRRHWTRRRGHQEWQWEHGIQRSTGGIPLLQRGSIWRSQCREFQLTASCPSITTHQQLHQLNFSNYNIATCIRCTNYLVNKINIMFWNRKYFSQMIIYPSQNLCLWEWERITWGFIYRFSLNTMVSFQYCIS